MAEFLSRLKEKDNLIINVDPKVAGESVRTIYESEDADIIICTTFDQLKSFKSSGKSVGYFKKVTSNVDIDEIEKASEYGAELVIVDVPNWKIIPLENIIAKLHKSKT
ncbi:MAG: 3-dehydroquinate synthase, partial [Nitrososphaera sp.]|nr:3-dehydroquinate synthase [Nitrososphaera sp.]